MATERNIVSRELNRIKEKHGLTHKGWAEASGVPVGTISRYLSYNVGVPNFAHICAMLGCVNESVDDFYRAVNGAEEKADSRGAYAQASADAVIDPEADKGVVRSMKERIAEQAEALLDRMIENHELDAQLREANVKLFNQELAIADKDVRITSLEADVRAERRRNRLFAITLVALIVIVIGLAALYIWDVSNLHKGLTFLLNPDL